MTTHARDPPNQSEYLTMASTTNDGWFTDEAIGDDGRMRIEILRVPPGGLKPVIALSPKIIRANIHYLNKRSLPCRGDDVCPGCKMGLEARPYGYLAVEMHDNNRLYILELTAAPFNHLRSVQRTKGTLRGALLNAYRKPKHAKGAIYVQVERFVTEEYHSFQNPDVPAILGRMWRIEQLARQFAARSAKLHADEDNGDAANKV